MTFTAFAPARCTFALCAVTWLSAPALAATSSAAFTFVDLPALTSAAPLPGGAEPVGEWLDSNTYGAQLSTWSAAAGSRALDFYPPAGNLSAPFASGGATLAPAAGHTASAEAGFALGTLSAAVHLPEPSVAEVGSVRSQWARFFQLDPHTSISFTGLATFASPGSPAVVFNAGHEDWQNAAWVGAAAGTSDIRMWARLDDFEQLYLHPDLNRNVLTGLEAFSFSTNPDGTLTLTATNTADTPLYGRLFMDLQVYAATPAVPEPAQVFSMLAGIALLSWVGMRRHVRRSPVEPGERVRPGSSVDQ